MSRKTSQPTQPKGVGDHPAKDEMRALWEAGLRGKAIAEWLVDSGYPPVAQKIIGRYGQRFWSEKEILEFSGSENDLAEIMEQVQDSGVGRVTKFTVRKQTAPRLEQGVLVDKETTTIAAEIVPSVTLDQANIAPISVHIPSDPPGRLSKPTNTKLGVFLPDMQIGYHRDTQGTLTAIHDEQALNVAFQIVTYLNETYSEEEGVDLVVFAGDNLDFAEFSSHRSAPGYVQNTQLAIDRAGTVCATSRKCAPNAKQVWLEGNHECLDEDTRAVTKTGLKYWWELEEGELVLSCDDQQNELWEPIQAIHSYDYTGELCTFPGRTGMRLTPNHRIVGYTPSSITKGTPRWKEVLAGEFTDTSIPTAVNNSKPDLDGISDDEIRLMAWCFTDSHINNGGYWSFFQAATKSHRIKDLLDRLDLSYRFTARNRRTTEIDGKKLRNPPQDEHIFSVHAESSRYITTIISSKGHLPDSVWQFSRRQMEIFYEELQYTDGTQTTLGITSGVIFHSRGTRYDLQRLFLVNGYCCTLTEYRPGHWRLNIVDRTTTRVEHKESTEYAGKVWCLTVGNGRFFACAQEKDENGQLKEKPFLTGNSRLINNLTDKLPGIVGLGKENDPARKPVMSVAYLLNMDAYGIQYIDGYPDGEYWANDFLRFEHGSVARSAPGATAGKMLDLGVSTLQGHTHRRELIYRRVGTKEGSRLIFAGSPGCLCSVKGLVPSSRTGIKSNGTQKTSKAENWHQGMSVFWYETSGRQHSWIEPVEIEDGKAFFRGVMFTATVNENGDSLNG